MKALCISKLVPEDDSLLHNLPLPQDNIPLPPLSSQNNVLVKVHAAGCNFYDILMVKGQYQHKPALPFIPGTEFSGTIHRILPSNSNPNNLSIGDRVVGMSSEGSFAEFISCPMSSLCVIPDSMTFEQAAGFLMTYSTSYYALKYRGNVQPGETVLVHASAGGVGSAAVQLSKALGATVIATAGSSEKLDIATKSGADFAVNYRTDNIWHEKVRKLTNGKGANVIFDPVGGEVSLQSTKCIAWNGRLLVVGFAGGSIARLPLNRLLLKGASAVGVFLGACMHRERNTFVKVVEGIFGLFEQGKIDPIVYRVYKLDEVRDALLVLGNRQSYGKVILSLCGEQSAGRSTQIAKL